MSEPWLAPRTHFMMAPDGSSGLTQGGEGIPNIDSVKKTIATYYGDPGTGIGEQGRLAVHHRGRRRSANAAAGRSA